MALDLCVISELIVLKGRELEIILLILLPDQSNLRVEGFTWLTVLGHAVHHGSKPESQQHCTRELVTGHPHSRNRDVNAVATQLTFLGVFNPGARPVAWCCSP